MDNLTHSLAGAVLGQMGLKKKTGLGMATLIIAANLPDIDAFAVLLGGHVHLGIRRGLTHGPIAMLVLPVILTGIMIWFDGWQTRRGKRPESRLPLHKGWLLALAFIGTLSHPALDWLNNYRVRLLEPFSSNWYYGDTIFIIDIWIWIALIAGVAISMRREKKGGDWKRPAWISFAVICAYIFANGAITGKAESDTAIAVEDRLGLEPEEVVANPVPVTFWRREMVWQIRDAEGIGYGESDFDLLSSEPFYWKGPLYRNDFSPGIAERAAKYGGRDAAAYLLWSRMPLFKDIGGIPEKGDGVEISDMRFRDPLVGDRFRVRTLVPKDRLEPAEE